MKKAIFICAAAILALSCASKQEGGAQPADQAELIAAGAGTASFDPGGNMFVFTRGMTLAVKMTGDDRVFHLTSSPPSETDAAEDGAPEEEQEAPECVPADPAAPVAGPQGGWHGHPSWSPDGRFIAFIAPWKDGNCDEGDDADWDVWLVRVDGLDLHTWVKEIAADKDHPEKKNHYIVGPDAAGLEYYQVTNTPDREQRPSWATCRQLAFAGEDGVHIVDLSGFPGICKKTAAQEEAEREQKLEKLTSSVSALGDKITGLEAKIVALQQPPEQTPAAKTPAE